MATSDVRIVSGVIDAPERYVLSAWGNLLMFEHRASAAIGFIIAAKAVSISGGVRNEDALLITGIGRAMYRLLRSRESTKPVLP